MLAALEAAWAEACDGRPDVRIGLAAAHTDWTGVSDARLDGHIASYRDHRRVHCRRNPDGYARDIGDEQAAQLACVGCPILLACREQALRQEQGAGESHGIRGGMTPDARRQLIEDRRGPDGSGGGSAGGSGGCSGRMIVPATVDTNGALALLAGRGYVIKRNTLQQKSAHGNAPKPLGKFGGRWYWDTRALLEWDFTVGQQHDYMSRHRPDQAPQPVQVD